jgi:2-oxoglutarate ferredoxin oxidoreductase subunit alpha
MRYLVQGNEAIFLGALRAGATFFAGYPITPSTEILILAAEQAAQNPEFKFIQSEDELAAANAIIGASLAGAKSFTATSGPGFSLMQEAIGYAQEVEVPMVIVTTTPSFSTPTPLRNAIATQLLRLMLQKNPYRPLFSWAMPS